jgi:hypothetical protein
MVVAYLGYYPSMYLEGLIKARKPSVKMDSFWTGTYIQKVPDVIQECFTVL